MTKLIPFIREWSQRLLSFLVQVPLWLLAVGFVGFLWGPVLIVTCSYHFGISMVAFVSVSRRYAGESDEAIRGYTELEAKAIHRRNIFALKERFPKFGRLIEEVLL